MLIKHSFAQPLDGFILCACVSVWSFFGSSHKSRINRTTTATATTTATTTTASMLLLLLGCCWAGPGDTRCSMLDALHLALAICQNRFTMWHKPRQIMRDDIAWTSLPLTPPNDEREHIGDCGAAFGAVVGCTRTRRTRARALPPSPILARDRKRTLCVFFFLSRACVRCCMREF